MQHVVKRDELIINVETVLISCADKRLVMIVSIGPTDEPTISYLLTGYHSGDRCNVYKTYEQLNEAVKNYNLIW